MEAGTPSDHGIEGEALSLTLNSFSSSSVKTQTQTLALLGHLLPINIGPAHAVSQPSEMSCQPAPLVWAGHRAFGTVHMQVLASAGSPGATFSHHPLVGLCEPLRACELEMMGWLWEGRLPT